MNRLMRKRWGMLLVVLLFVFTTVFSPIQARASTMDVLYDGTVALESGKTVDVIAYNSGTSYTIPENTPLGALQAAATAGSFTYDFTDKKFGTSGVLLLDNVGSYKFVKSGSEWYAYVNGVVKDGYASSADALNLVELKAGDRVEFYYADGIDNGADLNAVKAVATAAVKTVVAAGSGTVPGSGSGAGVTPIVTDTAPWSLQLSGAKDTSITQAYFEDGLACASSGHKVTWTDADGNVWGGVPLWLLVGLVDDNPDTGDKHFNFNDALAKENYKVEVIAADGYSVAFESAAIASNNGYIVANTLNGTALKSSGPLRLVGSGVAKADGTLGGKSVGIIAQIKLTELQIVSSIPQLHVVKYGADNTTILKEITVDYQWMEKNLAVIGDGTTKYRYEGVTNIPADIWDAAETYPGGFKIENAVKGTRIKDLCEQVGGMVANTEIVFAAQDGYETRLPYSSIYTDAAVQARQGDAILAWWSDGQYVPAYADGMRLFFTPGGDNVYGQWDMHETLPANYWHYYFSDNVQYASCAGLSAKYITEIRLYTVPANDWMLQLDGQSVGGVKDSISKTYFEQALACQFGANHEASYTDSKGRVWTGMPLWFLAGYVDDADKHSDKAFNENLAAGGYLVVIAAADGYSVTMNSKDIIRSSDYIIANGLNGVAIPETDSNWPLRVVGPNISGASSISQIASIRLVKIPVLNDLAGHWAQSSIQSLVETGVVSGNPDSTFKPDANITRAEFATILAKAFKLTPESGPVFADTTHHWAKNFITWAAAQGIVNGYDANTFGPDDMITREQMAVMIVKAAELELAAGEITFADKDRISAWAKDAVVTAINAGILKGTPSNTLDPLRSATRAEAVTVILNALKI